jgi:hypothetical protein
VIRTLTLRHSGAFQIVHDDVVQVSGDDPNVLPEPVRGVVLQRLLELRQLDHFEVHYEQRDDLSFTHLRPVDAPLVEATSGVAFPGFSTIHENALLLLPPPPSELDAAEEEPYEG